MGQITNKEKLLRKELLAQGLKRCPSCGEVNEFDISYAAIKKKGLVKVNYQLP